MQRSGPDGMLAVPDSKGSKTNDKPIKIGNHEFNRFEFSVDLRPGPNPLQISSSDNPSADIIVNRIVKDPSLIPVRYTHDTYANNLVFNKPTQGYLRVPAGEAIEISGSVNTDYILSLGLEVMKFHNGDYQTSGNRSVVQMSENKEFSGSIAIHEPGSYLINILNLNVFVGGESSPYSSEKWAEIVVEVLPKGK
ncbi:hypothetical protein [Paenibacillus sp. DYY-L-2]|uniref:hypothetical protein n=1 Tax=Paenibacillus sp. DYY-L-2 TaxID=3447013 RepID=UPI003F4F7BFA